MNIRGLHFAVFILILGTLVVTADGGAADVLKRHDFRAGQANDGAFPSDSFLIQDGSTLYGMTSSGGGVGCGGDGCGTIFKIDMATYSLTVLHSFSGSDGAHPLSSLIRSGSVFYGMTSTGGSGECYDGEGNLVGCGVIFKISTDGSGFGLLHEFLGPPDDGAQPRGGLAFAGFTLYGMTSTGGFDDLGLIFSISTDSDPSNPDVGDTFTVLYDFFGGPDDGANPYGGLTLRRLSRDSITLYGMTSGGGDPGAGAACVGDGCGLIFKLDMTDPDFPEFTPLHTFAGGANDGDSPTGGLTLDGTTLYGMTSAGGGTACTGNGCGVIFKISTDGSNFGLLHRFLYDPDSNPDDGSNPGGSLSLSSANATLYGTTREGGGTGCGGIGCGTVFSITTNSNADGTDIWNLIHAFEDNPDGAFPVGGSLVGNNLWGMTNRGGTYDAGTIFALELTTASELISFKAVATGREVILSWETGSETGTTGFHVWRSTQEGGGYTRITPNLVPPAGGAGLGATYRWIDSRVRRGKVYFYKLEEIDFVGGSTLHGPFQTEDPSITLVGPEDQSLFSATTPTFRWKAEGVSRFRIQFSRNPDFTGRVVTLAFWYGIKGKSYTPLPAAWRRVSRLRGSESTLYWRVFGRDRRGKKVISSPYSFDAS
jgi:uncharacterized repeat protein (TIGR03803 family)